MIRNKALLLCNLPIRNWELIHLKTQHCTLNSEGKHYQRKPMRTLGAAVFMFICAVFLASAQKGLAAVGAPPTGLAGQAGLTPAGNQAQVVLTWNASAGPVTGYRIRRYNTAGTTTVAATLNVSGIGTTTVTDVLPISGSFNVHRFYTIATVNGAEISTFVPTPRVDVLTVPAAPTGLARTLGNQPQVSLTWSATAGATSYRVKRSTTSGGPYTLVSGGTPTSPSFIDATVAGNTAYFYVVSAVSSAGEGPNSAQLSSGLTFPGAPNLIVAAGNQAGNGAPLLTWTPSGPAPTSYRVFRSTINDPVTGPQLFNLIATIAGSPPATSYADVTAPNEVVSHYYVTALNTTGESRSSFTNYALNAHKRLPRLLISEFLANPDGTDSPFEWVELIATDAINFALTPYSVVFSSNGSVEEDGWIGGCGDTYGFNITGGTVVRGGVVYVGGSGIATLVPPIGTAASRVRVINTSTTAGDRFGAAATGVLGNGGSDADGIAVFATDIRNLKPGTVPVDAVFFGTGTGTAVYDLGGNNQGEGGYELPINDRYPGGKFQTTSYFVPLDPGADDVIRATTGNFNPYEDRFTVTRDWSIVAAGSSGSSLVTLSAVNNNAPVFAGIPERFALAVGDTTNPQLTFSVTPPGAVVAAPTSDNQVVLPNANIVVTPTGTPDQYTMSITPALAGVAFISLSATFTPTPPATPVTSTLRIDYAASPQATPTTRFHTFASDASAAFPLGFAGTHMLVGDDEDQVLRIYDRNNSGAPLRVFDFTPVLGLTDRTLCGRHLKEVDIEAATSITVGAAKRIFWLGTLGNEDDGDVAPSRNRLFVTDVTGNSLNTYTPTYVGRYDFLRDDLIAWDGLSGRTRCDGAALPANYYGFAASAADTQLPKEIDGFAVEGLAMAPNGTTAYIGFRAPYVPPLFRDMAIIVPLLNINSLAGAPAGSAQFGQPIELDLGGRGIRSIEGNANGMLIVAGSFGNASDFRLFTWNGQCLGQPEERAANISAMNVESIVDIPVNFLNQTIAVQLLSDNGRTDWYGDGVGAKGLPDGFTKFRSDRVTLGLPVPTPPSIKRATVTSSEGWTFYPFEGGCCSQTGYQSTTSSIDRGSVVNPAPEPVYQRLQTTYTTMTVGCLSSPLSPISRIS
jgi:hypothetical protein